MEKLNNKYLIEKCKDRGLNVLKQFNKKFNYKKITVFNN